MIKNLRYAIAAIAMMTCGATYAQETTEPEGPSTKQITVNFYDVYKNLEKKGTKGDTGYLKDTQESADGFTFTYSASTGSAAPNFTFTKSKNATDFDGGYVKLFGGDKDNVEGNTMTITSAKDKIVAVKFIGTNAGDWGTLTAADGTIEFAGTEKNPNLYPTWTSADKENGVLEATFTVCRDKESTTAKQVRYTKAVITVLDNATGITSISANNAKNGARYNIAGQRVGNDFKGLVIENGQKKVVK